MRVLPLVAAKPPPNELPETPTTIALGKESEPVATKVPALIIEIEVALIFEALLIDRVDALIVVVPENVFDVLLRVSVLPVPFTTKLPVPVIAPEKV